MKFTVVIPSRDVKNLSACVRAVRTCEPGQDVIVVDDGIPSDWFDLEPIEVVRGLKPFVFARNVNIGIRQVLKRPETAGVVLLNDDAVLKTAGGFSLLAAAANEHPEYGVIAASTNVAGNPAQHRRRNESGLRDESRMVCFIAVYIPRRTFELVGLLDERFEGYGYDDDDFCLRVRRAGLRLGIHDGCFVDHESLVSSFRGRGPRCKVTLDQNRAIYQSKWGELCA